MTEQLTNSEIVKLPLEEAIKYGLVSKPLQPDNPEDYESDIVHGTPQFVLDAIEAEIKYQNHKYGLGKQQSLPGYLLIIQNELDEAKHGWTKNLEGRNSVLHELVQVAAVAIRALTTYGVTGSAISTNDTVIPSLEEQIQIELEKNIISTYRETTIPLNRIE